MRVLYLFLEIKEYSGEYCVALPKGAQPFGGAILFERRNLYLSIAISLSAYVKTCDMYYSIHIVRVPGISFFWKSQWSNFFAIIVFFHYLIPDEDEEDVFVFDG